MQGGKRHVPLAETTMQCLSQQQAMTTKNERSSTITHPPYNLLEINVDHANLG
jgi:hypothetical protein